MKNLKLALTVLYITASTFAHAQSDSAKAENKVDNTIYSDVDVEGAYNGGERELAEFVRSNFRMPRVAQELQISGMVLIQFVVEGDGTLSGIHAIAPNERQLGYGLEEECIRVIKLTSGNWTPAMRTDKPVRSYWRFPFEIDNSIPDRKSKRNKKNTKLLRAITIEDTSVHKFVDSVAVFGNGTNSLAQKVAVYFKMPEAARQANISGILFIQFVVEVDGSVTHLKPIAPKGKLLGYGLEEELMRVIMLTSGEWKPAIKDGKAVRSYWRLPLEIDNSSGF